MFYLTILNYKYIFKLLIKTDLKQESIQFED